MLEWTFGFQDEMVISKGLGNVKLVRLYYLFMLKFELFGDRQRNTASYYACSQLLASLSGFQYTRKAWRKDAMDLLLDPLFFQMEGRTLTYWRTIVDNLMSQDTASFRDLMSQSLFYHC